MVINTKKVLVIGFNTRPLAYSLKQAGYEVYVVDFFGDLDLYPNVKDSLIILKELDSDYMCAKDIYSQFLSKFTIKMLEKYVDLDYLIIGSGLDDKFTERSSIMNYINKSGSSICNANNDLDSIIKSRDIINVFQIMKDQGYKIPFTIPLKSFLNDKSLIEYPLILKKTKSSGGINIYKIPDENQLDFIIEKLSLQDFNISEWIIQEYLEGIPVSCTTISNGIDTEIISINRQIIGEKYLNPPKEFMYCGNIVPANLLKNDEKYISEISIFLANELGLKGINGFDFVLKNHYPYLMEINPRIPGSIRASECALNLNILDLHLKSFDPESWKNIKNRLTHIKYTNFTTKLIFFSPKDLGKDIIDEINKIENIHDRNDPDVPISKGAPICTVLFQADTFSESFFEALKVVDKIKQFVD